MSAINLTHYRKYLNILSQHRILFSVVFGAIVFLSIIFSYSLPKTYNASSTFFVEQNVISDLVRGIAITPSMSAKIKVMKISMLSREMLLEVIKDLDMDVKLKQRVDAEKLIEKLQREINIGLDENRGIFTVSFSDEDPVIARDFVNTLVNKYIEKNTASKRDESLAATRFLKDQIELFKQRMDKAEKDINEYKSRMGLTLTLDIGELRREIAEDEDSIDKLTLQRNHLEAKRNLLSKTPGQGSGGTTTIASPTLVRIHKLEAQRAALGGKYSAQHPKIKQIDAELAQLRSMPDAHSVRVVSRGSSGISKDAKLELEMIDVELGSIKERVAQIEENIAKNKRYIKEIPEVQTELIELNRVKENESIIYNQLVSRYGQSEVSKQMELEDKSMSFRVVDPAILPTRHSSPNRPAIIGAGIGLGLIGAAGLVFLLAFLKGSIHSASELEATGYPVIAVLPYIFKPENILRKRRVNYALALLVLLTLCTAGGAIYLESSGSSVLEKSLQSMPGFEWIRNIVTSA